MVAGLSDLPQKYTGGRLPAAHLRLFFRSYRTMYTPNWAGVPCRRSAGRAAQDSLFPRIAQLRSSHIGFNCFYLFFWC